MLIRNTTGKFRWTFADALAASTRWFRGASSPQKSLRPLDLMELEDRVLFSASALGVIAPNLAGAGEFLADVGDMPHFGNAHNTTDWAAMTDAGPIDSRLGDFDTVEAVDVHEDSPEDRNASGAGHGVSETEAVHGDAIDATTVALPLSFEANAGQTSESVDFLARGNGYTVFLTGGDAVLKLSGEDTTYALKLDLLGANDDPEVTALGSLGGRSNYLLGDDPANWRTGIDHYGSVLYSNVFDGIDLRYYGNQRQLEYDFLLAPGADPSDIVLRFEGAQEVRIDPSGELVLELSGQQDAVRFHAPVTYQDIDAARTVIDSRYVIAPDGTVRFELGAYDSGRHLVIDPVLDYGTYLGGTGADRGQGVAVDSAGDVYVTGYTSSVDFPITTGAYDETHNLFDDVYVTKLTADGTQVLYSTFIGGSLNDRANDIFVDAAGEVYVVGQTVSVNYPTTVGAFDTSADGSASAFVMKLSADGTALVYSTYLDGSGANDEAYGVAVDVSGNAFVVGRTNSGNFPTTGGALDVSLGGSFDAFVTKLNAGGTGLVYSTYLGGGGTESGNDIKIDGAGKAYVTGQTASGDFSTTAGAYDISYNGGLDAFVAQLDVNGAGLLYATYLGGGGNESGEGLALGLAGDTVVTGYTLSADFPTIGGAFDTSHNGGEDVFISRIDPAQSGPASLVASTFVGDSGNERGQDLVVDPAGNVHVVGYTGSSNFPTTADAHQASSGGGTDAFVLSFDSFLGNLDYATYLGGSGTDSANAVAWDPFGNLVLVGNSSSSDFDVTPGAYDTSFHGGGTDAFVVKFDLLGPANNDPVITSTATPSVPENATFVLTVTATDSDGDTPTFSIIGGADAARFAIVGATGVLTFDSAPDFESPTDAGLDNVYDVLVQASDGAGGSDTQAISATVTDVANTFIVTTTVDNTDSGIVAGNATHTIEWLNANRGTDNAISLREAILAANNTGGADDIFFSAPGTYTLTTLGDGEDFAATGDLDIRESLTLHGLPATGVIIDGSGMAATPDRIFDVHAGATVLIEDVAIQGGSGGGSGGGAAFVRFGASLTINDGIVTNNSSNNGGAIQNDGTFAANFTSFTSNSANSGAAIDNSGTLTLTDVAIMNNAATNAGGGIRNNGTATLDRVTVSGNSANQGGAIHNGGGLASMSLTNVTISGNTATAAGGGIWTNQNITATNVTIAFNQTTTPVTGIGGGVLANGPGNVTMLNSILYNNTADIGPNANRALATSGYNISDATAIPTPATGDRIGVDPLLTALASNGGYTQTHALTVGSQAINNGTAGGAPATDQRGYARSGATDIGAFEFNGNTPPSITSNGGGPAAAVNVAENTTAVTTVTATDADLPAQTLNYAIVGGADAAKFNIDTATGVLAFNVAPNFEAPTDAGTNNIYDVTVQVSDGLGGTDTQIIAVTVTDVAEIFGVINVNETPNGNEQTTINATPKAIASDASGNFVAVWESDGQDGSNWGIYGRRFHSGGAPNGSEFRVNTTTTGDQLSPAVAMNASGAFVAVFQTEDAPSSNKFDIYAVLYDNTGSVVKSEFLVNSTYQTEDQTDPSVALRDDGSFVVTWTSNDQDGDKEGIFAQNFDAMGNATGGLIQVNNIAPKEQRYSSVATNADGDFIVTWSSKSVIENKYSIAARQFDSSGAALGKQFKVDQFDGTDQLYSDVALADDGSFVVTWQSTNQDAGTHGIYALRYDAAGDPIGNEFLVNQSTAAADEMAPSVSVDSSGNFVITWTTDGVEVYSREFDALGNPITSSDIHVTPLAGNQFGGAVTVSDNGDYVVVFSGAGPGDTQGVFAQRYDIPALPVVDANGVAAGVDFSASFVEDSGAVGIADPAATITDAGSTQLEKLSVIITNVLNGTDESLSADTSSTSLTANYSNGVLTISGTGPTDLSEFITVLRTVEYNNTSQAPDTTDRVIRFVAQDTSLFSGPPAFTTVSIQALNDQPIVTAPATDSTNEDVPLVFSPGNGNAVSIEDDAGENSIEVVFTATNGTFTVTNRLGDEARVNAAEAGDQKAPGVAVAADGRYVVVWHKNNGVNGDDVYARTFNSDGTAISGDIIVPNNAGKHQRNADVAIDDNGNFVVVYEHDTQNFNDKWDIYARTFDINGNPLGGNEVRVNSAKFDDQLAPSVTMDNDGTFVVAWQSKTAGSGQEIYIRPFDLQLNDLVGNDILVNSTPASDQTVPDIAIRADGQFVVAWQSKDQDGSGEGIYLKRFNAGYSAIDGSDVLVNVSHTADHQTAPAVAINDNDQIVVTWQGEKQDDPDNSLGVFAQRFDFSTGLSVGGEIAVNTETADDQTAPNVAIGADGKFAIVWQSHGQEADDISQGIFLQEFNTDGTKLRFEELVNTETLGDQFAPTVSMTDSSQYVVVWQSVDQDATNDDGIYSQRFLRPGALSFTVGDGTNDVTATFTGRVADINQALDGMLFTPNQDFNGSASLQIDVDDLGHTGTGVPEQDSHTIAITVNAVNDQPLLSAPQSTQQVPENQPFTFSAINSNAVSLADVDALATDDLKVTLSVSNGILNIDTGTGVTITGGANDSASVTFTGTQIELNDALDGLIYTSNITYLGPDTLNITVDDQGNNGSGGPQVAADTVSISVFDYNIPPVNNHPASVTTTENTSFAFTGANTIEVIDNDALGTDDIDVKLTATHGLLKLLSNPGISITGDWMAGDTQLILDGDKTLVNTALSGLSFQPDTNYAGPAYLQITTNDQGNSGIDGDKSDLDIVDINVTPNAVNDAPTVVGPAASVTNEETPITFTSATSTAIQVNDDANGNPIRVTITAADGTVTLSNTAGTQFQVNTTTDKHQQDVAVAMNVNGDFLVVWESENQDTDGYGIYAQRYDASGLPVDSEFKVNATTNSHQTDPAAAMADDGSFVVTWVSEDQDGNSKGVIAQHYDANGDKLGGEILVNTYTNKAQQSPDVAMDATGRFVIVWESDDQDGDDWGIYGQVFDNTGAKVGSEFRANFATAKDQLSPAVAMDADGDFVVTWQSQQPGTEKWDIVARRFDANGAAKDAGDITVNSVTDEQQEKPDVAMDQSGNFVVAWQSKDLDYPDGKFGIYHRRFNADGTPATAQQVVVNTRVANEQQAPSVAMDRAGEYVVSWQSKRQDNPNQAEKFGVFAQRYNADGTTRNGEFQVNTTTNNNQQAPAVAIGDEGQFVIVWESESEDGDGYGVFAQRYRDVANLTFLQGDGTDDAVMRFEGTVDEINEALDGLTYTPNVDFDFDTSGLTSLQIDVDDLGHTGSGGSLMGSHTVNITVNAVNDAPTFALPSPQTAYEEVPLVFSTANGNLISVADVDAASDSIRLSLTSYGGTITLSGTAGLSFTTGDGTADEVMTFTGTLNDINAALDAISYIAPAGFAGQGSIQLSADDLGNNGAGGSKTNNSVVLIDVDQDFVNDPPEINVPGPQQTAKNVPLRISDLDGNQVTIDDDALGNPIRVQLTVTNGTVTLTNSVGSETLVNTHTDDEQRFSSIATTPNGNFVAVWQSKDQDGSGEGIFAQRFNAAGNKIGPELQVNQFTAGNQTAPVIAVAASGEFAIAWVSDGQDGNGLGLFARKYDGNGNPLGDESLVNTGVIGNQEKPSIAMDAGGAFVVAWQGVGVGDDIYAQRFDANGVAQGSEIVVNTTTASDQEEPAVAMDAAGNFVIAWKANDAAGTGIFAQRFDAAGNKIGTPEFQANTLEDGGNEQLPSIAMNASGQFVIAWQGDDSNNDGIRATFYDTNASIIREDFIVNQAEVGNQKQPSVALNDSGQFVVAWHSGPGGGEDVIGRMFDAAGIPTGGDFAVNTTKSGGQTDASVAMDAAGSSLITWSSGGNQDGDKDGIYLQRLIPDGAVTFHAGTGANDVFVDIEGRADFINGMLNAMVFKPTNNFTGEATIDISADDQGHTGTGGPYVDNDTVFIMVDFPSLDLDADDSSGADGANYLAHFTPGGGAVNVIDVDKVITTPESQLKSVTITLTNRPDGANESLIADTAAFPLISHVYNSGTGVLSITGQDLKTNYAAVLNTIRYNNTAGTPVETARIITVQFRDKANADSNIATTTVLVDMQPPVLDVTGELDYTESDPPTLVISSAMVNDLDTPNFTGGILTIDMASSGSIDDRLAIRNEGTGVGQISIVGLDVQYNFGVGPITIGSFTAAGPYDGLTPIEINLNGSSDAASVAAIIENVTFENVSGSPATNLRAVRFVLDDGEGGISETASATIRVTDMVGSPVGSVSDTDGSTDEVAEGAADGTAVGITAFANDPDMGDTVTYSLDDNAGGRFAINGVTGVVTVANGLLLDREAAASHNITVRATSADTSFSTQGFTVSLNDVDEFNVGALSDSDVAFNAVDENAANGTLVGITAFASDADATTNTITYSLDDNAGGRFAINGVTGVVTVANGLLLDREAAASHNITVRATSADTSFSTQGFTISLNDVDEFNVGALSDSDVAFNAVDENAANGTLVGITAFASDADATTNTITYSLDDNAGGRFGINAATGVVTVADGTLLNREAAASHGITVRATSSDTSFSTQLFTINILPVNDNSPVITSGSTPSINENQTIVQTLTATDADLPAQTITFAITGGDDAAKFTINGAYQLVFAMAPDFEIPTDAGSDNVYELEVTANDGNGGLTPQSISVTVNNVVESGVLVVDTTNDIVDGNVTSIGTLLASRGVDGRISLREAILAANNTANGAAPDEIRFSIPDLDAGHRYYRDDGIAGSLSLVVATTLDDASITDFDADYPYAAHSWFRINLNPAVTELDITDAVIINGYSQPGATQNTLSVGHNANLRIELTSIGADGNQGINVEAGGAGSTIRGLAINRFDYSGIMIDPGADGVTIQGNYIGTNITGTIDLGNGDSGVQIRSGGNLVGGANLEDRNVISGNDGRGVVTYTFGPIETGNVVENNYIGVDATGVLGLGNDTSGIQVYNQDGLQILDNVISGNTTDGIWFRSGGSASNTVIQGNLIGVGADKIASIGNGDAGILIENGATGTTIGGTLAGQANTIAHNAADGVAVTDGVEAAIRGNAIFSNGALGIDLQNDGVTANDLGDGDVGPNGVRNYPVLTDVLVIGADLNIAGTLNALASLNCQVDFYWSPVGDPSGFGEGQTYIGSTSVLTDGSGNASFNVTFVGVSVPAGAVITATTTDSTGNTSEFSLNRAAVLGNTPPAITSSSTPTINENQTIVQTLTATDGDLPAQIITFAITGGVDAARFTIGGANQLVFLTAPDFEMPTDAFLDNDYEVQVTADDGAGGSAVQAISVTVTPVNDNLPVITSLNVASIAENTTAVLTVTATDADQPGQSLSFSISGGADAARFTIGGASGMLVFNAAQDYEAPADAGLNNVYDVQITVSDGAGGSAVQAISVTVTPVNDNLPVITSSNVASIAENTTAVLTVTATDADLPGQSLSYSISGGADAARFTIGGASGMLVFNAAQDYEAPADAGLNNVYDVQITVSDGAGGSAVQAISVTVTPVNDNLPVITSSNVASIAENTTAVLTVTATDADLPGQSLSFSISGGADAARFTIGGASGVLAFNAAQDYEAPADAGLNNVYDVQITVSDGAGGSAVQAISVTVTPVNDNLPVITSSNVASIAENTTAVLTVTANDADLPGQSLSYSISGGADAARFTIGGASGMLAFNAAQDYEAPADAGLNNVYDVQITVSDGAGGSAVQAISVTVTPVNDNLPVITSSNVASIAENTTAVLTVTANDADLPGQSLSYSISGGADAARFTIGGASGMLAFNAAQDYEAPADAGLNNVYDVQITVSDGAGGSAVQAISVTVTPVNDNLPVITSSNVASIAENTTAVLTVTANDADLPGQSLSYSISGGADAARFTIGGASGMLAFNAAQDYEAPADAGLNNVYDVQITVSDGAGGSAVQAISVTVTPVNDNLPVITSSNVASIAENTTGVLTVTATDADLPGQSLSYSISGGADAARFTIGGASGMLAFNAAQDYEAPADAGLNNVYDVQITVSDGAGGSAVQAISVTVTPVNEAPAASDDSYLVNEDTTLNVAVTGVLTNDSDVDGDPLTAVLVSGPSNAVSFSLNTDGSFSYTPNANFNGTDSFTYRANDGAADSNTVTVTITVNAVNDVPVAADDSFGVEAGGTLTVAVPGVLVNDVDVEGDPLTANLVATPNHGVVSVDVGGSIRYTPVAGYFGGDSFTYTVNDGASDSNVATVTITVELLSLPPFHEPPHPDHVPSGDPDDSGNDPPRDDDDSTDENSLDVTSDLLPEPTEKRDAENENASTVSDAEPAVATSAADTDSMPASAGRAEAKPDADPASAQYTIEAKRRAGAVADHAQPADDEDSRYVTEAGPLWDALDDLRREFDQYQDTQEVIVGTVAAASTSMTAGYVLWLLRGGLLASSVLAQMPAWRLIDPLPILNYRDEDEDGEDDSLESMVDRAAAEET